LDSTPFYKTCSIAFQESILKAPSAQTWFCEI